MEMKYINTSTITTCGSCCRPISDRYILRVVDTSYHESCLQCICCRMQLMHSCFIRDGKFYCRIDYERQFVKNRCLGCGERIGSDEFVMRTNDSVFHLKCFVCVVCGIRLQKGEQYVIKQNQLFCRSDYEKEVEMLEGGEFAEDLYCEDIYQSRIDGRRGPKRPRTILTTQQRRAFKASFEVSPKPCRKVRENLARDTGLSIRIVQVWFQNQRAKVKKIQNKAKQDKNNSKDEVQNENDEGEGDKTILKIKDENQSDSDSFGSGASRDNPIRAIKEEIENDDEYFKVATSYNRALQRLQESNLTGENIPVMNFGYSTHQQIMTTPQILNPIDRLYSMQSSYFKNDDLSSHLREHM